MVLLAACQAGLLWAGWVWWAVPTLEGQYRQWLGGAIAVGIGNAFLWMFLKAVVRTLVPNSAPLAASTWFLLTGLGNIGLGWGSEQILCDLRFPRWWLQGSYPLGIAVWSTLLAGATGALPLSV
ncbi:MAG: hypothetical protein ACUVSQ_04775 [Pseudanabaenaceae cyanobacterium]